MTESVEKSTFQSTKWTVVLRTRGEGDDAKHALEQLCADYWLPLYTYARRRHVGKHDAEDLVQGFLLTALNRQLFQLADPSEGRLRYLLLTAFKRYMQDMVKYDNAAKRCPEGGWVSLDFSDAEDLYLQASQETMTAEANFDYAWALRVLEITLDQMEERYANAGKQRLFALLRSRLLLVDDDQPVAAIADELEMTENALRVALCRMRSRFRDDLRQVIRDTVGDDEAVDLELGDLQRILSPLWA